MNKKKVEQEAKDIIDKFGKALSKVKSDSDELYIIRKPVAMREDADPVECKGFRAKWFKTAPKTKHGYLQAEKGGWV